MLLLMQVPMQGQPPSQMPAIHEHTTAVVATAVFDPIASKRASEPKLGSQKSNIGAAENSSSVKARSASRQPGYHFVLVCMLARQYRHMLHGCACPHKMRLCHKAVQKRCHCPHAMGHLSVAHTFCFCQ